MRFDGENQYTPPARDITETPDIGVFCAGMLRADVKSMTIQNAIKKLSKFGTVESDGRGMWRAVRAGWEVSFLQNGRGDHTTCDRTRRVSDQDDPQTDYCAGSFWPNLTQAIAAAERHIASDERDRAAGLMPPSNVFSFKVRS